MQQLLFHSDCLVFVPTICSLGSGGALFLCLLVDMAFAAKNDVI